MQTPPFDNVTEFLELFGGPIALVSSIAFSNGVAYRWKNERNQMAHKHMAPVLYWGPLFLMTCMVLHCFRNAYESHHFIAAGMASFRFYQYSLQMFGVFLFYQAYLLLQECRRYVQGNQRFSPRLYGYMLLIIATTLPTWIFTPIGIVPTVVLTISLLVSFFVHKFSSRKAAVGEEPVVEELQPTEAVMA